MGEEVWMRSNSIEVCGSGCFFKLEQTMGWRDVTISLINVVFRLLGPAVAQDVLQISNTLYNEGGGRIQLPLNPGSILGYVVDDFTDGMYLVNNFFLLITESFIFNLGSR